MAFLTDAIRTHLDGAVGSYSDALLAVVDKCEQLSQVGDPFGAGRAYADTFLSVIARELGIQTDNRKDTHG
jgi:hypothetical protein